MAALANPAFLYVGSDKYASVAPWASNTAVVAGQLMRQLATPAVNSERVFVCIVAGTTTNGAEPAWTLTKGFKNTDNTATWQECTGQPAVNGDVTNTKDWNSAKSNTVALGQIIKNIAANTYFICTTAGTSGSGAEPTWNTTAGATTTDNTITWTSLGAVGNFAAFAAPHARILNADGATWSPTAGSKFFISSAHAETQASAFTLSGGQGTAAAPNQYLCVANTVAPPTAVTTGASVSTTGANNLSIQNYGWYDGIAFSAGDSSNVASINVGNTNGVNNGVRFNNPTFKLNNTATTSRISFGVRNSNQTATQLIEFFNPTYIFGSTSQSVSIGGGGRMTSVGGAFAATGSVPTTAFNVAGGSGGNGDFYIRGMDLSSITGTMIGGMNGATYYNFVLENCKLGAAVAMTSGASASSGGCRFTAHNCDSGSKNYRFYENNYLGTIQNETTTVRTGGATDGTTPVSWNIASSANTSLCQPFSTEYLPIAQWQDTTGGSKTATVEIAGATTLTNGDIWMEIEYPGNASFPLSSVANNRVADVLTTSSNVTTSAAAWGGSPAVTQKLQVTFTPQMKGPIKARIFVAKPSVTVYVDPLITVA